MKSIVLCESTLVNQSEDPKENLKEGKVTEDNEKAKEKKIMNGSEETAEEDLVEDSTKENVETFRENGEREFPKESTEEEIREEGEKIDGTTRKDPGNGETESCPPVEEEREDGEEEEVVKSEENSVVKGETVKKNESENVESVSESELNNCESQECRESMKVSDAESSVIVLESESESESGVEASEENREPPEELTAVTEEKNDLSSCNNSDIVQNKEEDVLDVESTPSAVTSTEEKMEEGGGKDGETIEDVILDLDEDKENEKEEKDDAVDCENDEVGKCDIQVGECQTVSDSEKDCMWIENDEKETEEISQEGKESDEDLQRCAEGEKESEEEGDTKEKEEEKMEVSVEEKDEPEMEMIFDKSETEAEQSKTSEPVMNCKKRQLSDDKDEDSSAKRKRLSVEEEENAVEVKSDEDIPESESVRESSPSMDTSKDNEKTTRRSSTNEKTSRKLSKEEVQIEVKDVKTDPAPSPAVSSFLANFRGSLKSLTRGDLEELIVQKLCEVITERSNVGELRRKAQALEQDQERWKSKVQSLTKQMKEMEMVMKKYMNEVQKQIKDGDSQVVTPLKVTRSVGLQVSFYFGGNKGSKPNVAPPAASSSPAQNVNGRPAKPPPPPPPKLPPQYGVPNQNPRNKPGPASQKSSPSVQKPPVPQQKRPVVPRSDHPAPPQNRPPVPQSVPNNGRGPRAQAPGMRPNFKPGVPPQQQPQQQQQQQQQQNGSKVIDLTEDDDRQTGNPGETPGSIRVVNHLSQQPPVPQNNRFAYLLPATSTTPTGTSGGQSRQVLIATPTMPQSNRQLMCSMPPLLFKGGNIVQSGSQTPVSNNRVILPKTLRHPAPLPQSPVHQNKPNLKLLPPRPALKISKVQTGIVLSWNMSLGPEHAPIASYQLYAYQESNSPPATSLWKKVGDVKALPLPMACTLTQFMSGHKYHFAVRAVDLYYRTGPFSFPGTIVLVK